MEQIALRHSEERVAGVQPGVAVGHGLSVFPRPQSIVRAGAHLAMARQSLLRMYASWSLA